jgi:hypothetical protein
VRVREVTVQFVIDKEVFQAEIYDEVWMKFGRVW